MANETQKLKFTSLDEAKEFLLQSKEQNTDVSQKVRNLKPVSDG